MTAARCIIEVLAGVLPGQPDGEVTRRFTLTSDEWDSGSVPGIERLLARQGAAMAYALALQNPGRYNWVRLEWLWL